MKQLFLFVFSSAFTFLYAQTLLPNSWVTKGNVSAIVQQGNTVYVGGNISYVGPNIPYAAALSAATAKPNLAYAKPNAAVTVATPDGNGGWYIGGNFTQVGGQARKYLARLNANGSLHAWNPNITNTSTGSPIKALVVGGGNVYVAGESFGTIGGQARTYLAALDTATGAATSWNPAPNNSISAIVASDNKVFLSGSFTSIAGQTRRSLAAINATTGAATAWDPNTFVTGISTIALSGSTLYVGGSFTTSSPIGGQLRNGLAALDTTIGLATSWNPNPNGAVASMIIDNNKIYVRGAFSTIGGQTRNRLAALDPATGMANSWNPGVNVGNVDVFTVGGNVVYFGGGMLIADGQPTNHYAAVDATTGATTAWAPNANYAFNEVYDYTVTSCIAVKDSVVYTGGSFSSIGGQSVRGIAAVDATTGFPVLSWNANANSSVSKLLLSGNTLYVTGSFTSIGGQPRNNFAALDATTGLATAFNPGAGPANFVLSGNKVYVGGSFTSIGGQPRNFLAALDATTGLATSWNPTVNNYVSALAISGGLVYIGGQFSFIGGQGRNYLAALDTASGLATPWSPNPNDVVRLMTQSNNTLYVQGNFTNIGGQARSGLASLDANTGAANSWNPAAIPLVTVMAVSGNTIYIGREDNAGASNPGIPYVTALNATTGAVFPWNPNVNGQIRTGGLGSSVPIAVRAIAVYNTTVYIGGTFANIGDITSTNFAALSANNSPLPLRSVSLQVRKQGNSALLNWEVDNEDDVTRYELEKSADGRNFSLIGTSIANGLFKYQHIDVIPFSNNYYRIKAVLKTGNIYYSKVVRFTLKGLAEVSLYPNPGKETTLQLQLNNVTEGNFYLTIYNLAGQKILQQNIAHAGGSSTATVNIMKVSAGVNIVTLTDKKGNVILKERWIKL